MRPTGTSDREPRTLALGCLRTLPPPCSPVEQEGAPSGFLTGPLFYQASCQDNDTSGRWRGGFVEDHVCSALCLEQYMRFGTLPPECHYRGLLELIQQKQKCEHGNTRSYRPAGGWQYLAKELSWCVDCGAFNDGCGDGWQLPSGCRP